jgi:hypothetical protein
MKELSLGWTQRPIPITMIELRSALMTPGLSKMDHVVLVLLNDFINENFFSKKARKRDVRPNLRS